MEPTATARSSLRPRRRRIQPHSKGPTHARGSIVTTASTATLRNTLIRYVALSFRQLLFLVLVCVSCLFFFSHLRYEWLRAWGATSLSFSPISSPLPVCVCVCGGRMYWSDIYIYMVDRCIHTHTQIHAGLAHTDIPQTETKWGHVAPAFSFLLYKRETAHERREACHRSYPQRRDTSSLRGVTLQQYLPLSLYIIYLSTNTRPLPREGEKGGPPTHTRTNTVTNTAAGARQHPHLRGHRHTATREATVAETRPRQHTLT